MTQKGKYTYEYPRPAVATDIAVLALEGEALSVLLVRRGEDPFKDAWALPGGFLKPEETTEQCAQRELAEETGVEGARMFLCGVFSQPKRDPRNRVISVAYVGLVNRAAVAARGGSDAAEARWWPLQALPPLAFDHAEILAEAIEEALRRAGQGPLAADLLAEAFSLSEFQAAQECLLGQAVDRRNFRRAALAAGWLEEAGEERRGTHRPAALYRALRTQEA